MGPDVEYQRAGVGAEGPSVPTDTQMLDWLQEQAEQGCVTMCFEFDGGVHVTLDPVGYDQRAAREVASIRDGVAQLMLCNNGEGECDGKTASQAA